MFDPYFEWLGLPVEQRPPTPFQLLALTPGHHPPEEIQAATEFQLQRVRQFQNGANRFQALKLVSEILEARDSLLDPNERDRYLNYAPKPVVVSEESAWYQHSSEAKPQPVTTAALNLEAPDLAGQATKNWWVGEAPDETVTEAPVQAKPVPMNGQTWWADPSMQELEPLDVPPPPPTRPEMPPMPAESAKIPTLPTVTPSEEPVAESNPKKVLIWGGIGAALFGIAMVVAIVKFTAKTPEPVVDPKTPEVVLNPTKTGEESPPPEKKKIEVEPTLPGVEPNKKEVPKEIPKVVPKANPPPKKKLPFELKEIREYRLHTGAVWGLALAPDANEFYSVGVDKLLFARELDPESKSIQKHQFLEGGIQVASGSAMNLLAACDGANVVVFDPGAAKPRRKISTPVGGFRSMALHPNGVHLLTGSSDGSIRWWNINEDKLEGMLELSAGKELSSLAISADGSVAMAGTSEGKVFIIDVNSKRILHSLPVHSGKRVTSVAISPDGLRGASAGEDRFVQVWDLTKKSLTRKLDAQPDLVMSITWGLDSRRLFLAGLDPTLKMYDTNNGKLVWSAPVVEKSFSLAVEPHERFALVGGDKGTIRLVPLPRIATLEVPKEILVKAPQDKLPTPSEEEIKLARQKVRQDFAEDFERRLPVELGSLIQKLTRQGVMVQHPPEYRHALFDEAGELAVTLLMLEEAYAVAEGRAQWFLSDELKEKATAIKTISEKAPNPQQKFFAEQAIALIQTCQRANRFELLDPLVKVAEDSARFSGVKELIEAAAGSRKQVQGLQLQRGRVQEAKMKLSTMPNDPEANTIVGRHTALVEGNWSKGLEQLAKGNDPKWKALAESDLAQPKDAPAQYKLATSWFEIAGTVPEDEKNHAFQRAKLWYEKALENNLGGTDKLDALSKVRKIMGMK